MASTSAQVGKTAQPQNQAAQKIAQDPKTAPKTAPTGAPTASNNATGSKNLASAPVNGIASANVAPKNGATQNQAKANSKEEQKVVPATAATTKSANAQQQKPGTATNTSSKAAAANAPGKTTAAAGTTAASKDSKSVAPKPSASGMTPDEEKQLAAFKLKLAEKTAERKVKEDTCNSLKSLISIKQQIEKSQKNMTNSLKNAELENDRLEQEYIALKVQNKREDLIQQLNAHKKAKKTDPFITSEMTKMEKSIAEEMKKASNEEAQLTTKTAALRKQIETQLPQEEHKLQEQNTAIKTQRPRLTKELATLKDQVNEVNAQEAQLCGKGILPLQSQIEPSFKGQVTEENINSYATVLSKILVRLEGYECLMDGAQEHEIIVPEAESIDYEEEAVDEIEQVSPQNYIVDPNTPTPQQPTPYSESDGASQAPITPEQCSGLFPFIKPATPQQSPNPLGGLDFLKNQLGIDIIGQVQEKARATVSILDDKQKFVQREQVRVRFLEEEKLLSMKKIIEYRSSVEKFPEEQKDMLKEIESKKDTKALMEAALEGLFKDKEYMAEIQQMIDDIAAQQAEEVEGEEGEAEQEEMDEGEEAPEPEFDEYGNEIVVSEQGMVEGEAPESEPEFDEDGNEIVIEDVEEEVVEEEAEPQFDEDGNEIVASEEEQQDDEQME